MNKTFWGLIFLFFDINISTGMGVLSLMPVFVGYWLIANGTAEMKSICNDFGRLVVPSIIMILFCTFTYAKSMFGITFDLVDELAITIIGCMGNILILLLLTKATNALDKNMGETLEFGNLYIYWCGYAVSLIAVSILLMCDTSNAFVLPLVVGCAFGVLYVCKFRKIKIAYENIE